MQFREPFLLPNDTEIIIIMFDTLNTNSNNYYILQIFTRTSSIHPHHKYSATLCIYYAQDISIKIEIKAFNPTTQHNQCIYTYNKRSGAVIWYISFDVCTAWLWVCSLHGVRSCHADWYNIVVWWNTTQRSSSANNRIEKVIIAIIISYYSTISLYVIYMCGSETRANLRNADGFGFLVFVSKCMAILLSVLHGLLLIFGGS